MMAAPAGCGTSDYGFASNVICVAAALAAYFVFGLDWLSSVLLCIPVRGVILRLKANDGLGIVQYAILFLLYPVVARMSSVVAGKVNAGLSSHAANAANHPYAMHVAVALVNGAVIAVMLLAAFAVAAVVSSSLFRSFAMPAKVHRIGGVPHVMILTHSGKQLGEISGGGMNADAYVSKLKDIMRNKGNDVGPEAASLFAR